MFKKILVSLDGSEIAESILPFVSTIASGLNIPVVLATVVDPDAIDASPVSFQTTQKPQLGLPTSGPLVVSDRSSPDTPAVYRTQLEETAKVAAENSLRKVALRLSDAGVEASVTSSLGSAAEEIVRLAERQGCDLIAMATHGRSVLGRAVLGSVTDKVVHSSHIPTLTLTPEGVESWWQKGVALSRVIVPLDGSDLAETALPYARALALGLSLEIVLVRAVKPRHIYDLYAYYPYVGTEDLEIEVEQSVSEYLETIAADLRSSGLNARWEVLKGQYAAAIVDFAKGAYEDIVVLTTHGHSGLTRWVLGSVTEALVRSSGDPVLLLPPGPADGA